MAMTYTTLLAPKGQPGSIATWVGYTKLDLPTVLDEAQSLLYSMLRVRSMRTEWTFGMSVGMSEMPLPDRFLDPIGSIWAIGLNLRIAQRPQGEITARRVFDSTISGALGIDPATTVNASSRVVLVAPSHNLSQGSTITIIGLAAVGGLTLNGTFPVTGIIDANTITIEAPSEASASATGGGASGTYTANKMIVSTPQLYGVWDDKVKFECAFETNEALRLPYYRAPKLLSADNPSNWLTTRYPRLLRTACQAAAADFMKDGEEYTKAITALTGLIQSTAAEDDLMYRGADLMTETP